ncbi:hypothetical protein AVDCRST_MAG84-5110 [uncultured Microcoleus sp.]|uniref:Uncharacterized protein n=1 Tax=uncultured Microcoleus sp. TaxID=259945 RepID=A0A6J4ND72_9CYAN|nr:hypothetical protein AVDCRST_MAG84-5110 [uncultured Microcoleus sp.]
MPDFSKLLQHDSLLKSKLREILPTRLKVLGSMNFRRCQR